MSLGFGEVFDYMAGQADWLGFGLPTEGKDAGRLRVGGTAHIDVATCRPQDTLGDARKVMESSGWDSCVVVNDQRVVLGRIRREDLDADDGTAVEEIMSPGPTSVRPSEYLDALVKRMRDGDVEDILVTTSAGELVGILLREDAERRLQEPDAA